MAQSTTTEAPAIAAVLDELRDRVCTTSEDRESIAVECPFTAAPLGHVPRGVPADVREAANRARRAQAGWANASLARRSAIMLRFHDLLLDRQDEVLDLVQLENGKARRDALEEVLDVATNARYHARTATTHLGPRRRAGALPLLTATREYRHPRGIVGFITPWNYPLTLTAGDLVPALLAGNGAVVKPDEKTPFTCLWAVDLLEEAGLPEGLVQVVTGPGEVLGAPIVDAVDFVSFTGSTRVGRIVAARAAERLIDFSMELGGKNAMLVLDDADLERAVAGAQRALFSSGGQMCVSIERVLVQEGIHDEFRQALVDRIGRMELGTALDYSTDMGSLASAEQLERTTAHVQDAVDKGARVLVGGRPRPDIGPWFFEPTVLEGVTADMVVHREETFGPVAALASFATVDEAVAAANDTRYGLNASVWTGDAAMGEAIATRIAAGTVNVNDGYAAAWGSVDSPMGGFKDSGLGRRHGAQGIQKYTESQTVAIQRGMPISGPEGWSGERYARVFTGGLRLLRRLPVRR